MNRLTLASVALVSLAYGIATPAMAQQTPAETPAASDEDIIVTAQRREQRLQDVPLAVTSIGGDILERGRVTSVTDLQTSTPGLNATTGNRPATSTSFSLRGVGTSGNDPGLEAAVGFAVDGVPRARSGTGLGDLVDVERIEILRGPQGTLFGKNTSAGVIQVTSRDPNLQAVDGFMDMTVGNYNLARFRGAVNLPLAQDKVGMRVSFGYNRRDGFINDPLAGTSYNDRNRFAITGRLLFEFSPDVHLLIAADYAETDESCCQSVRLTNAVATGGGNAAYVGLLSALASSHGNSYPVTPSMQSYATSVNAPITNANRDRGIMARFTAPVGAASLTSITSYRQFTDFVQNDVDFSGADLVSQAVDFDLGLFTQELRLQGDALGGGLDWLIGGFYSSEKIDYHESVTSGRDLQTYLSASSAAFNGLYPRLTDAYGTIGRQSASSVALFTHNIFHITDQLNLTAGLRWTSEHKSAASNPYYNGPNNSSPFASAISPIGGRANPYDLAMSDSAFSGTVSLAYNLTSDVMTYASYSRGYKAGGFGLGRDASGPVYSRNAACAAAGATPASTVPVNVYRCTPVDPRFAPETVNAYEVGLRSQFFDRALTFNLTLFQADYKNLQLNTFTGTGFFLSNAGDAQTRGAEMEVSVKVAHGIRVGGNLNYLDATYGASVPAVVSNEPALAGQHLNYSPKWAGSLFADFNLPLSDSVSLYARPEMFSQSSFAPGTRTSSLGTPLFLPGFTLFNMSAGLRLNDKWDLSVFCRNCTDRRYATGAFASVAQTGSRDTFVGNPAEYGMSLRFEF
jgi:iron complex outermembrane recepter protein